MNFQCNLDCLNCTYADCIAPDNYAVDVTIRSAMEAVKMEKTSLIDFMRENPEVSFREIYDRFHVSIHRIHEVYRNFPEIQKAHDYALHRKRSQKRKDYTSVIEYMREHPEATTREIKRQFKVSCTSIYRIWEEFPEIKKEHDDLFMEKRVLLLAGYRQKRREK